jgi:hypothetical protein
MIEVENHPMRGMRVRIVTCRGEHGKEARGKDHEGCVCSHIGTETTLGNKLILMTPAPDSFRVVVTKGGRQFPKLVRLEEIRPLIRV